jgi:hypothetical protein
MAQLLFAPPLSKLFVCNDVTTAPFTPLFPQFRDLVKPCFGWASTDTSTTLRILYGSITPRGSPRRSFCLRLSRYGLYGSLRLCKPMYESPRRSFRSSMDPLRLHMTLRPCSSIYEYPHKPARQSTTPFRHLQTPLRACRIQIHS